MAKKAKAGKAPKPAKSKPAPVDLEADDDIVPVTKPKKAKAGKDEDPLKPRARNDIYFGLTLLTTLILGGAAALIYMDQEDVNKVSFNPPSVTATPLHGPPPKAQN